jgi:hypothetical protein
MTTYQIVHRPERDTVCPHCIVDPDMSIVAKFAMRGDAERFVTPNLDDLNVRILATGSFLVTMGVYAGPITRAMIGEHVRELVANLSDEELVDSFQIVGIHLDDGTELVA